MVLARTIKAAILMVVLGQPAIGAPARDAAPCVPTAEVEGDGPVRAPVIEELRWRGISTTPVSGCASVSARIGEAPSGLVVIIVDAYGRTSERTANGPAAAATLIESWVRTDLTAPLLSRSATVPTEAAEANTKPTLATAIPSGNGQRSSDVALAASAETSLGTDGSVWVGMTAGLCLRVGPACVGTLVRVSSDSRMSGDSHAMHTGRFGTDVLLGAWLPIRAGRLTFLPGAAVGVGWLRTTSLSSPLPGNGGDSVDVDGGGLRASAALRVSLAVSRRVAVDFGIAADVAPVAHTAPYNQDSTVLAGEPRGFVRGGLGVRLGTP